MKYALLVALLLAGCSQQVDNMTTAWSCIDGYTYERANGAWIRIDGYRYVGYRDGPIPCKSQP